MSQTPSGFQGQALPLADAAALQPICGDFDIRIDRNGTWYYRNSPIHRLALVKLFASVLRRVENEYWLVTPVEQGRIAVEEAPFLAVALCVSGVGRDQRLIFRTNLDELVTAGLDHPIWVGSAPGTGEPRPYIEVRAGLAARIVRPVYYELAELAQPAPENVEKGEEMTAYGVWSAGSFFALA